MKCKLVLAFFMFANLLVAQQKTYHKIFDSNGVLLEQGWLKNSLKIDYWYVYHANGKIASKGEYKLSKQENYWYFYTPEGALEKEGHFSSGLMSDWWIFYTDTKDVFRKIQYQKNKKEGYSILYKKDKIIKIEKYHSDLKINEWTDVKSFMAENDFKNFM